MKKIIIITVALLSVFGATAQTSKESPWKEIQTIEIPAGQNIYAGVTSKGNPKYWFTFGELDVTVSESNAAKYKAGEVTLLLVKWQHKETLKFRYTTRQKKAEKKSTPNVDLTNLFN